MIFRILTKGHKNVSSLHKSTFEITKDVEIGPTADCIIGVDMDNSMLNFPEEFKQKIANSNTVIKVVLDTENGHDEITGWGHEDLTLTHPTDIVCRIIHGGTLSNNKGINVPGVKLSMPFISEADMNDLEFGAKMGYDFIAASFVRSSADINYLRKYTHSLGWFDVRIIAKIENLDGVENIDEILEVSDGIMVARGDMGVEIPFEQIPAIQKTLIHKGYNAGKQVITATQMLESMISNPRPTRAEITDVANAIYDGTSAIMLSGETAAGAYPVDTLKTMALIAESTEKNINYRSRFANRPPSTNSDIANAIAHATVTTAHDLNASAIITVTKAGSTARLISTTSSSEARDLPL